MGPPGAGKTLLARALPSILPRLTLREALDITRIYSVADALTDGQPLVRTRPFRAPHHTISHAGLVGGGRWPRPGELSLVHRSVLFLDELPEFGMRNLETLRQPLEDRVVTISRATGSLTFPANFVLVAAMNPCPCGYFGDDRKPIQHPMEVLKMPLLAQTHHAQSRSVGSLTWCQDGTYQQYLGPLPNTFAKQRRSILFHLLVSGGKWQI
jgi:predicted ATPase with chaperone activity